MPNIADYDTPVYYYPSGPKVVESEGVPTVPPPPAVMMQPIDPLQPAHPRYESQWAQEMAAEGCTDIPVSWYRQTPWSAVSRKHGRLAITFTVILSFGLNVGFGFLSLKGNDQVGLWRKPSTDDYPNRYGSVAISDLILTIVIPVLITGMGARRAGLRALKKGHTVPIDPRLMEGGLWNILPMHLSGQLRRGLRLLILSLLLCGVPFVVVLEVLCTRGKLNGKNSTCSFNVMPYVFIKATWAAFVHGFMAFIVLLLGINAAVLEPKDQVELIRRQRERWAAQMKKRQQTTMTTINVGQVVPAWQEDTCTPPAYS